jgi:YD repeat-containing protein
VRATTSRTRKVRHLGPPAVAALAAIMLAAGSDAAALVVGATSCSVDYRASSRNLDCRVAVPGGTVSLEGRLAIVEHAVSGAPMRFTYDSVGRLVRAEGPNGVRSYSYDDGGRLLVRVEDGGETTRYAYDGARRLVAAGATALAYSDAGLVRRSAPDGGTTEYAYDSRGNLVSVVDSAGGAGRFTYDRHGQVLGAAVGAETIAYSYDRQREPVVRTTAGTTTSFDYGSRGELVRSVASSGETVDFDYERSGAVRRIAGPSGATTLFTYDSSERLVAVSAPDGTRIAFTYDDAGHLAAILPDAGDEVLVGFDAGDPAQPLVIGFLYGDVEPPPPDSDPSVVVTTGGRMLTCKRCP